MLICFVLTYLAELVGMGCEFISFWFSAQKPPPFFIEMKVHGPVGSS